MDAPATRARQAQALELRRTIPAPCQKVFAAWTGPEVVGRWFAPTAEYRIIVHELDLRVGGRYRFEMRHPDKPTHIAVGVYREIEAPSRLVFTWRWEGRDAMPETEVALDFLARGESTELTLTHRGFDEAADRDRHSEGWSGCLTMLAATMQAT